jgi:hypothetical protein
LTIAFFIYSDDHQGIVQAPNNPLPLKDARRNGEFSEFIEESKRDAERGKNNKKQAPVKRPAQDEEALEDGEEIPEVEKKVVHKKAEKDALDYKKKPLAKKKSSAKEKKDEDEEGDDSAFLRPPVENSPDAPGEMGRAVVLPTNMSASMKKAVDDGWLNNAFNQYASDLISVRRRLPDPRDEW